MKQVMSQVEISEAFLAKEKEFSLAACLDHLRHYLPSQTPLKDFVHHNSLHAFQDQQFFDAIFQASQIFGYQVTLELNDYRKLLEIGRIKLPILERLIVDRYGPAELQIWKSRLFSGKYDESKTPRVGHFRGLWKTNYNIDLENEVQPLLFRLVCNYLDQGIALWHFPTGHEGLIAAIRALERESYGSLFKSSRCRQLLMDSACTIESLLGILVGDADYFEQYVFDQQFAHRGWSGMVATLEKNPEGLLSAKNISLQDFIQLELLLELDALESRLGRNWQPLCASATAPPVDMFAARMPTELEQVFELWQLAFEGSYYDEVLAGLASTQKPLIPPTQTPDFQALFCIDERECSLRRHLEQVAPFSETLGSPGYFGVEFYFQAENAQFYDKLCPAPVTPKYLIKESKAGSGKKHEALYTQNSATLFRGALVAMTLGFWAALKLVQMLFRPKMSPAISNALAQMDLHSELSIEHDEAQANENGLQIGFTVEEMAARVEVLLRSIGLINGFAPLIYVVAHGSSSANNPHHGAHDCGACSGRPGAVNAKVFAFMANHFKVRESLHSRGISIPSTTQFIGALHDTAADQIAFYDLGQLSPVNEVAHLSHKAAFEKALDLNAKERSRRFASIPTFKPSKAVRKAIHARSVSLFEPRPELGHGTNTLCFVGRRALTKGLFLDRRAFLNSYDYRTDPEGKLLAGVMRPLGPVCGGINLEYYFSRVDNHKLGAGTKLPHNVMGLIGVANSCDGDLRPGLPLQMIEVHDPVRLLIIVEHHPDVVLRTIQSDPAMYQWFINDWVNLVAFDPASQLLFQFKAGEFLAYTPISEVPKMATDFEQLLATSKEMETNHILDATLENMPVFRLQ